MLIKMLLNCVCVCVCVCVCKAPAVIGLTHTHTHVELLVFLNVNHAAPHSHMQHLSYSAQELFTHTNTHIIQHLPLTCSLLNPA